MAIDFGALLRTQVAAYASDLHLVTGEVPHIRDRVGSLMPLPDTAILTGADILAVLTELAGETGVTALQTAKEYEIGFARDTLGRFRATFYIEQRGPAVALRAIPTEIPTPAELGLPQVLVDLVERQDGLILVTGPNGHGKSTTLASLINHINRTQAAHIITIEDPIEFVYPKGKSIISQRAAGLHTQSFATAVRHTVRQDADVIVVGEMRDMETIATALTLAETGHLVLGTLHTHDAPRTVQRIIGVFPPEQQRQIAIQLSHSLSAVVAQRLLPTSDGTGRVCAREIMLGSSGVRHSIRELQISELYSQIQINREMGMISFDESLRELIQTRKINLAEAVGYAQDPAELRRRLHTA
jgi:twitching motility protein PilT